MAENSGEAARTAEGTRTINGRAGRSNGVEGTGEEVCRERAVRVGGESGTNMSAHAVHTVATTMSYGRHGRQRCMEAAGTYDVCVGRKVAAV